MLAPGDWAGERRGCGMIGADEGVPAWACTELVSRAEA